MQISVVIIAKNESDNLKLSLPALSWCNDIIVVDDFSTDDTKTVAESYNARVFQRKFDGFGNQKRFAVEQALNDWVLNIDADEVLSLELIQEINSLRFTNEYSAYSIPIRHVFMGKVFLYGKESKYYHLRLFNRLKGNFDTALVHEKVVITGPTLKLNNVILHYSYKNLSHYFQKFNSYTDSGARNLKAKGKKRPLIVCLLLFPVYFLKHYIIYCNILNGNSGFIWSYLNAWYHTVKYLKLYELNKKS